MQWATVYDTLTESETPHIIIKKRGGSIDSAELYVPKGTVIDTYDISYPCLLYTSIDRFNLRWIKIVIIWLFYQNLV